MNDPMEAALRARLKELSTNLGIKNGDIMETVFHQRGPAVGFMVATYMQAMEQLLKILALVPHGEPREKAMKDIDRVAADIGSMLVAVAVFVPKNAVPEDLPRVDVAVDDAEGLARMMIEMRRTSNESCLEALDIIEALAVLRGDLPP